MTGIVETVHVKCSDPTTKTCEQTVSQEDVENKLVFTLLSEECVLDIMSIGVAVVSCCVFVSVPLNTSNDCHCWSQRFEDNDKRNAGKEPFIQCFLEVEVISRNK